MAFMSITFLTFDQSIPIPLKYEFSIIAFQWLVSADNLSLFSSQSGKVTSLLGHSAGHSAPLSSIEAGIACKQVFIETYLKKSFDIIVNEQVRSQKNKLELSTYYCIILEEGS